MAKGLPQPKAQELLEAAPWYYPGLRAKSPDSKRARQQWILAQFSEDPFLMTKGVPTLFNTFVERGYTASLDQLDLDKRAIIEAITSNQAKADRRAEELAILDRELARTLDDEERSLEPVTKLIAARQEVDGHPTRRGTDPASSVDITINNRNKYDDAREWDREA